MKLGYAITIFDGLELLDKAIHNHLPVVDVMILCFQRVSNTGQKNFVLQEYLEHKYKDTPKVHIVEYGCLPKLSTKENERRKHQLMIDACKQLGCSHMIMAAVDHFYHQEDILKYREIGFDLTFTKMFTYYKDPTWQLTPIEDYFMPFIFRLYPNTKIMNGTNFPLLVDPSVRINTHKNWFLLDTMLHHYSMVRVNLRDKLENSASRFSNQRIDQYMEEWLNYDIDSNPGVSYFHGRKIKLVPNYFNL